MDKKTRIKLGLEKSVAEQIHDELFKSTTEYQYYLFGVAQGMFSLYSTFDQLKSKNMNLTSEEAMQVIKNCVDGEIKTYFNRLVTELEKNNEEDIIL